MGVRMNLAMASFIFSFGLIIWLVSILAFWQIFEKAGVEGWKSIIPVYSSYVLAVDVAEQSVWVWLLSYVPVIGLIGIYLISVSVAKAFGKSTTFAIIGLMLFSYFGYLMLGWGQAKYTVPKPA
jgi:hypothetical protein